MQGSTTSSTAAATAAQDPECRQILRHLARSVESVARRIAHGDHEGTARQFVDHESPPIFPRVIDRLMELIPRA